MMRWYLIHTKLRQEKCALENLENQGYECYLPTLPTERLLNDSIKVSNEPLFPRYLFIRLGQGDSAKSWSPIRSTKGVCRLVSFGSQPAQVEDALIETLRMQEKVIQSKPARLFNPGEIVRLSQAPFTDIEGIYQMTDGECRAMVLIEILSKSVPIYVNPSSLRKAG